MRKGLVGAHAMRILVTGGVGFIGSLLYRHLVGENNFDKLTHAGNLRLLGPIAERSNYRFLKADICDRAAMDSAFADFISMLCWQIPKPAEPAPDVSL